MANKMKAKWTDSVGSTAAGSPTHYNSPISQETVTTPTVPTRGKLSHKGQWMLQLRSEPTVGQPLTNVRSSRVEVLMDENTVIYLVTVH